jgi:plasmid replication initiation protein
MSNFKTYVLDFALNQINELTDITAKYEQHKKGRTISGFSFTFRQKKNASKKEIKNENLSDFFSKITDPQRHLFANKLSRLSEMSIYSQGTETFEQFAVRIAEMLKDAQKFEELFPYLQKVGFASA